VSHPAKYAMAVKGQQNRDRFLRAFAKGGSVKDTCRLVGTSNSNYSRWRARYPEFAAEVDAIRSRVRANHTYGGSFTEFRKRYFGFETYPPQARIIGEIERAAAGEVVLVLVPPEWGKTTVLEDYMNFRIANDPNIRITLVSEGQPHARKILRRVQKRMVDRAVAADYMVDFGPFYTARSEAMGKPWSADFFTVMRSTHDERDYTLEARGWRSAIAGTRTDLLLIDDIQSVRSLNATEKMVETFRQDMLTRPGRVGRTTIVGTRVGDHDFYQVIQDEGIVDRTVIISAVDHEGRSNCPEMWPTDALAARREKVGEDVWWRTYMQKPRRGGAATFPLPMIEAAQDLSRTVGDMPRPSLVLCGWDPALVNWNAFVVAACNDAGLFLVDIQRDRNLGATEHALARLDVLATRYRPDVVIVETNAFQKGLADDQRVRTMSREHGFVIVEHESGSNKLDDQLGVGRMPTSFVKGEISIPWGDADARICFSPLIEELEAWRPIPASRRRIRQDLVMAMWFCWLEWQRRMGGGLDVYEPVWRTAGLPWPTRTSPLRIRKAS
jgi:hypothetical protein